MSFGLLDHKQLNHLAFFQSFDNSYYIVYQQIDQSLLTLSSLSRQKTTTYVVGNLGPGLVHAHQCGGVKPVNGIPIVFLKTGSRMSDLVCTVI
jgi:hypothetical protein